MCFIVDAFSRMIVGWRVASHMRTGMVLDALEMARWSRGTRLEGLVAHSDAGSQFTSIRYGERLAELGAQPSIGSVGDSFDNALAETVNGLYKTELIRGPGQGPWKTVEDVELATLGWVHWHNTERLHGYLGDVPPTEFETAHYAALATTSDALKSKPRVSIKPRAIHGSMPSLVATATDRSLSSLVTQPTASMRIEPNAWSSKALAASVAYPWPHAVAETRHPTVTVGSDGCARVGTPSPTTPTSVCDAGGRGRHSRRSRTRPITASGDREKPPFRHGRDPSRTRTTRPRALGICQPTRRGRGRAVGVSKAAP